MGPRVGTTLGGGTVNIEGAKLEESVRSSFYFFYFMHLIHTASRMILKILPYILIKIFPKSCFLKFVQTVNNLNLKILNTNL